MVCIQSPRRNYQLESYNNIYIKESQTYSESGYTHASVNFRL